MANIAVGMMLNEVGYYIRQQNRRMECHGVDMSAIQRCRQRKSWNDLKVSIEQG
ncbi:hypothetical protein [Christensenella hongkongensis]|uniref:Uncharacterized protein n=1 Tax=Christensenella hongkongensis TaxID=270498 RepID=A0A0M2NIG9_9FIRM|nr:hypothetical protein [Christensenella hongkongensis]KKI51968.1 hypothetical protein CHK_0545 [Christensenella hongkongensis]